MYAGPRSRVSTASSAIFWMPSGRVRRIWPSSMSPKCSPKYRFQQNEFADRRVAVEAEALDELPTVMADRNQLEQVFFNITKNALDAMQPERPAQDSGPRRRRFGAPPIRRQWRRHRAGGLGAALPALPHHQARRPRPRAHDRPAHQCASTAVRSASSEDVGTVVTLQFPRKDRRVRMLGG